MRELGGGLDESEKDSVLKNREAFEKMLVDGMNGVSLGGDSGDDEDIMLPLLGNKGKSNVTAATPPQAGSSKQSGAKDDFQKNIRQTMDKLKESESTIKVNTEIIFCTRRWLNWDCRISSPLLIH